MLPHADSETLRRLEQRLEEAEERLAAPIPPAQASELEETLPPPPSLASLEVDEQDAPTCPITCEPMTDPVILSDGWSYERAAVERWVSTQRAQGKVAVSAMTRERLLTYRDGKLVVFPNYALKHVMVTQ